MPTPLHIVQKWKILFVLMTLHSQFVHMNASIARVCETPNRFRSVTHIAELLIIDDLDVLRSVQEGEITCLCIAMFAGEQTAE
jgi:hypothetical protein